MKIICLYCGEINTQTLELNLWEIHKSLLGIQSYCPKCGRFLDENL